MTLINKYLGVTNIKKLWPPDAFHSVLNKDTYISMHNTLLCSRFLPHSSPTCGFSPPIVLPSVWKGFGLTDTQQDYHHSTQETTHLSLQLSHFPPTFFSSLYPSIFPSIDCYYSWTPVIPLLVQLKFPFPSHHSAVCVCPNLCISSCFFGCHN